MAKTLANIQSQIAKLQREADALRAKEVAGVVERIQQAIAHYGLTPADLFGGPAKAGRKAAGKPAAGKKAGRKPAAPPKYHDGAGRTWSGHGKRPNWFKEGLAAGKTPEDMAIKD